MGIKGVQKSAFNSNDNFVVASIGDIPSIPVEEREGAIVVGGSGGGIFVYDATLTQDNHNNMTIYSADVTRLASDTGCWKRIYTNNVGSLAWAGVDSTTANLVDSIGVEGLIVHIPDTADGGFFKFVASEVTNHDGVNNFNGWVRTPSHMFTQDLQMQGNKISGVGTAVDGEDATNLAQVTALLGAGFSDQIHFGVAEPTDPTVNPIWVDTTTPSLAIYFYRAYDDTYVLVSSQPDPATWLVESSSSGTENTLSEWVELVHKSVRYVDTIAELRGLSGIKNGQTIIDASRGVVYEADTSYSGTDDGEDVIESADGVFLLAKTTHRRTDDDGVAVGATNVKPVSAYASIASDVRMSYIAHGGHSGFPNVIGSFAGSDASYAIISGGYDNIIDCIAGTISGGAHHRLHGDEDNTTHNTIGGGSYNEIERGEYSLISGGTLNRIKKLRVDGVTAVVSTHSVIAGGRGNYVHGGNSAIGGGLNNLTDGDSATCAGGQGNSAAGNFSTISGGGNNDIKLGDVGMGQINTIGGGRYNEIDSLTNPAGNTISGGGYNSSYGSYNSTAGGYNCTIGVKGAEPSYAVIGGGLDNVIVGPSNAPGVLSGRGNTASADYCTVTGGRGTVASAPYARGHGYEANARHQSGDTIADGKFTTPGDAQTSVVVRRVQTTDETLASMGVIELPNDSTFCFSIMIVARRADADDESGAYKIEGCIDRNGSAATTAMVGTPVVTVIAEDTAAWDVNVIANSSSGGATIQVTGEAGKTVSWVARCTLVEVSG